MVWIPTSEKYPPVSGRYIVQFSSTHRIAIAEYYRGRKYPWVSENGNEHKQWRIEAWMPLPEQYCAEKEE